MTTTINGIEYDEADLSEGVKFAAAQLRIARVKIATLQSDLLNQQIIVNHHSMIIEAELPSSDEAKESNEVFDGDFNG